MGSFVCLTQYGDDHVVLHHFHRTVAYVVDVRERVPFVHEVLAGGTEVVPNVQRQQLEAALRRRLEYRQG